MSMSFLIPEICEYVILHVILHGTLQMQLRIMKGRDYPGLSMSAQCNNKYTNKGKREAGESEDKAYWWKQRSEWCITGFEDERAPQAKGCGPLEAGKGKETNSSLCSFIPLHSFSLKSMQTYQYFEFNPVRLQTSIFIR